VRVHFSGVGEAIMTLGGVGYVVKKTDFWCFRRVGVTTGGFG